MHTHSQTNARRSLVICLFVVGLAFAIIVLPYEFGTQAVSRQDNNNKGLFSRTVSHDDELPNYDIREDKKFLSSDQVAQFRNTVGKSASDVASIREAFVSGEEQLRQSVPTLKIDYNTDIRIPEVIGPDVKQGRAFLTRPSSLKRSDILKDFLVRNSGLVGITAEQANQLKVFADYTNPDGNLSFVELDQEINGIPVFRGEVKAGFTKAREMVRVINNFAPGLDYGSLSTNFGDPANAVAAAAGHINYDLAKLDMNLNSGQSSDIKAVFGTGDWATTAEKMYFPTEPGVAVAAWRVLIWEPVNAYYVIVDASTGTMLWRKNIAEDQTQSATYNVYVNSGSMVNLADSPAPLSPGPINPGLGTQGAILSRTATSLIGNEAPYTFNNNGWITDGGNITDGNAVEAGLDLSAPDGIDAGSQQRAARIVYSTRHGTRRREVLHLVMLRQRWKQGAVRSSRCSTR